MTEPFDFWGKFTYTYVDTPEWHQRWRTMRACELMSIMFCRWMSS
jgi:hypothetical protein